MPVRAGASPAMEGFHISTAHLLRRREGKWLLALSEGAWALQ
jgi:hypothetical protein